MIMLVTNYSPDDLKKLSLRAIVAFAARCARRAAQDTEESEHPGVTKARREAVQAALRLAEDVARGKPREDVESVLRAIDASRESPGDLSCVSATAAAAVAAHAAASGWPALGVGGNGHAQYDHESSPVGASRLHEVDQVTADLTVLGAFTAAEQCAEATQYSDEFILATIHDYETLLSLNLGSYPEAGQPVDPSPLGPLGPL
jgi:hypothetical protein